MIIRAFTPEDYAAICDVTNVAFPEYPETPDEVRDRDNTRNSAKRWARWVGEAAGQVVAHGQFVQAHVDAPGKFEMEVTVLPKWREQGVGSGLYDTLIDQLQPLQPVSLSTSIRESETGSLRFFHKRGFVEVMREQESRLDLAAWNAADWQGDLARAEQEGIRLVSYAEMKADTSDLDALHRRLDDLHWAVAQDIPHSDTLLRPPHEDWVKRFARPDFLPRAHVYALDGDVLVGGAALWVSAASSELFTGGTGVLRSHRGRGIATALKVRTLTFARQHGATAVRTWNEVNNQAMLGINRRLGFVPLPAWIEFRKTFVTMNTGEDSVL